MPGRKYKAGSGLYRYGFNGKEKCNEEYGEGNVYDYGFRIYNPRIAKFLSVDPLTQTYPSYTPYQFAGNKPIAAIDLDGLEEYVVIYFRRRPGGNPYKVVIHTVKVGTEKRDQNVQKVIHQQPDGNKVATNNVLVFEVLNEGIKGKESMTVSDKERASLNDEELSVYTKKNKHVNYKDHNTKVYPFADNNLYQSEPFENANFYEAEKIYNTEIKDLTLEIGGAIHQDKKGSFELGGKEGRALKALPGQIKDDGDIKSINITIVIPYNSDDISNEKINDLRDIAFKTGQNIKKYLLSSGVKESNINVYPDVKSFSSKAGEHPNGKAEIQLVR
jgi:RHS repeat-associated protein